jgi:zinc/manganese transport system ATP-binding protein
MMHARTNAITVSDLTLGYDRHPAVHHLDGCFKAGSLTAIIGPNGAGKSTLLKALAGTLKPLSGSVAFEPGKTSIAYLPQSAEIDHDFPISVEDLVATGLWKKTGPFGALSRTDRTTVAGALESVGLAGFEARILSTLSGGQLQRVLFARLMVQDADVILIDEPFAAIDTKTVRDLMHLVRHWHSEGRTIVAVLHDMALVENYFPDCLLLAREPVAWGKTPDVLTPDHLAKARAMIEANDPYADLCERAA